MSAARGGDGPDTPEANHSWLVHGFLSPNLRHVENTPCLACGVGLNILHGRFNNAAGEEARK